MAQPKGLLSWMELCLNQASEICDEQKTVLCEESRPLIPYLAEMNQHCFYTCSSQPTRNGIHPRQRAYVSGYMPSEMRQFLLDTLPPDIVIWESEQDSGLVAARDADDKPVGFTWCGEMLSASDQDTVKPYRPMVVAFHAIDSEWDRDDGDENYLFSQIVECIKEYHAAPATE